MEDVLLIVNIVAVVLVLGLAFLAIGVLRSLGVLGWRLDQMEATTPRRIGRDGIPVGRKAPDFSLPDASGGHVSLHDFAARRVLLVFTQSGCGPCHDIMPELNRVQDKGDHQVLVVNNGEPAETRQRVADVRARFPVLVQEHFGTSKRYEAFVTPFAFVIDERGIIASKGIAGTRQHLGFVLSGAGNRARKHDPAAERDAAAEHEPADSFKEVSHA